MKFVLYSLIFSVLGHSALADAKIENCDNIVEGNFVEYNKGYGFWLTWNNDGDRDAYLNNGDVNFLNGNFIDRGKLFENGIGIDWTQELKDAKYRVAPHSSMKVLSTKANDWLIDERPKVETNATVGSFDFMIMYAITYDYTDTPEDKSDDITYTNCALYSVRWEE